MTGGKPRRGASASKRRKHILVVDDEENMRWTLTKALEKRGYQVTALADGEEAIDAVARNDYALVLMDIKMPRLSGIEALKRIRELKPDQFVVLMTAYGTMRTAIDAMKEGAFDYITKPFESDQIYALIDKAILVGTYRREVDYLKAEMAEKPAFGNIIGRSRAMQQVYKLIGKVAPTDFTALIRGDSGTGKELVASAIHHYSLRSSKPLVIVNMAAIPPNIMESELFGHERGSFTGAVSQKAGKFELANGGTLFLDEIGDMDYMLQSKILRVLQEQEFYRVGGSRPIRVDVRVIAATNKNLEAMTAAGTFRRDLYYRLNAVSIHLPPLRDRKDDLPLLIDYFMAKFLEDLGIERKYLSAEANRLLLQYDWPGNVREVENSLKRAMVLAPTNIILPDHLPEDIVRTKPCEESTMGRLEALLASRLKSLMAELPAEAPADLHGQILREVERPLIRMALRKTRGNKIRAAALMGINRNTLNKKIRELEMD